MADVYDAIEKALAGRLWPYHPPEDKQKKLSDLMNCIGRKDGFQA